MKSCKYWLCVLITVRFLQCLTFLPLPSPRRFPWDIRAANSWPCKIGAPVATSVPTYLRFNLGFGWTNVVIVVIAIIIIHVARRRRCSLDWQTRSFSYYALFDHRAPRSILLVPPPPAPRHHGRDILKPSALLLPVIANIGTSITVLKIEKCSINSIVNLVACVAYRKSVPGTPMIWWPKMLLLTTPVFPTSMFRNIKHHLLEIWIVLIVIIVREETLVFAKEMARLHDWPVMLTPFLITPCFVMCHKKHHTYTGEKLSTAAMPRLQKTDCRQMLGLYHHYDLTVTGLPSLQQEKSQSIQACYLRLPCEVLLFLYNQGHSHQLPSW